jgi:hypothetical protein
VFAGVPVAPRRLGEPLRVDGEADPRGAFIGAVIAGRDDRGRGERGLRADAIPGDDEVPTLASDPPAVLSSAPDRSRGCPGRDDNSLREQPGLHQVPVPAVRDENWRIRPANLGDEAGPARAVWPVSGPALAVAGAGALRAGRGRVRWRSSPAVPQWLLLKTWSTVTRSRSDLDRLFDYKSANRRFFFPFGLLPSRVRKRASIMEEPARYGTCGLCGARGDAGRRGLGRAGPVRHRGSCSRQGSRSAGRPDHINNSVTAPGPPLSARAARPSIAAVT